jgi:methionyl-tRNA formyltransferase
LKIAYFGLPLGALLLRHDGHLLGPIVLSPVAAPGRFRLTRLEPRVVESREGAEDGLRVRVERALDAERPDLLVSWFWTRKLPADWLAKARWGGIGAHPSLLPRHRGPNPYFGAIDAGDPLTGVTVHRLTAEYDTGSMLATRSLAVGARNAWQLARALDRPSLSLLRETVQRFALGERPEEVAQDEALATWAPEPTHERLKVDFGWTTERVLRRIRALSPTPGVALSVEGVELFVTGAEPAQDFVAALLPGEAHISSDLTLRTADGAVRVTRAFFPETEAEATSAEQVPHLLNALRGPNAP